MAACKEVFATQSERSAHILSHGRQCTNCTKTFYDEASLYGHTCHSCPSCYIKFSNMPELKEHMRIHKNLYQCAYCCKPCAGSSSEQREHLLYHQRVRWFRCVQCNIDFKKKSQADDHMKSHQIQCREDSQSDPMVLPTSDKASGAVSALNCDNQVNSRIGVNLHKDKIMEKSHAENIHQSQAKAEQTCTKAGTSTIEKPLQSCDKYSTAALKLELHKAQLMNMKKTIHKCQLCHKTFSVFVAQNTEIGTHDTCPKCKEVVSDKAMHKTGKAQYKRCTHRAIEPILNCIRPHKKTQRGQEPQSKKTQNMSNTEKSSDIASSSSLIQSRSGIKRPSCEAGYQYNVGEEMDTSSTKNDTPGLLKTAGANTEQPDNPQACKGGLQSETEALNCDDQVNSRIGVNLHKDMIMEKSHAENIHQSQVKAEQTCTKAGTLTIKKPVQSSHTFSNAAGRLEPRMLQLMNMKKTIHKCQLCHKSFNVFVAQDTEIGTLDTCPKCKEVVSDKAMHKTGKAQYKRCTHRAIEPSLSRIESRSGIKRPSCEAGHQYDVGEEMDTNSTKNDTPGLLKTAGANTEQPDNPQTCKGGLQSETEALNCDDQVNSRIGVNLQVKAEQTCTKTAIKKPHQSSHKFSNAAWRLEPRMPQLMNMKKTIHKCQLCHKTFSVFVAQDTEIGTLDTCPKCKEVVSDKPMHRTGKAQYKRCTHTAIEPSLSHIESRSGIKRPSCEAGHQYDVGEEMDTNSTKNGTPGLLETAGANTEQPDNPQACKGGLQSETEALNCDDQVNSIIGVNLHKDMIMDKSHAENIHQSQVKAEQTCTKTGTLTIKKPLQSSHNSISPLILELRKSQFKNMKTIIRTCRLCRKPFSIMATQNTGREKSLAETLNTCPKCKEFVRTGKAQFKCWICGTIKIGFSSIRAHMKIHIGQETQSEKTQNMSNTETNSDIASSSPSSSSSLIGCRLGIKTPSCEPEYNVEEEMDTGSTKNDTPSLLETADANTEKSDYSQTYNRKSLPETETLNCDNQVNSQNEVNLHEDMDTEKSQADKYHQSSRWFQCVECNVGFKEKSQADDHMKNHQIKRKTVGRLYKYKCTKCGVTADSVTKINVHMNTHCREDVGSRETDTSGLLMNLKRTIHKCQLCSKTFSILAVQNTGRAKPLAETLSTCPKCKEMVTSEKVRYKFTTCGAIDLTDSHISTITEGSQSEKTHNTPEVSSTETCCQSGPGCNVGEQMDLGSYQTCTSGPLEPAAARDSTTNISSLVETLGANAEQASYSHSLPETEVILKGNDEIKPRMEVSACNDIEREAEVGPHICVLYGSREDVEKVNKIGTYLNEEDTAATQLSVRRDMNSEEGPHICVLCGEEFKTWEAVNAHLQSHIVEITPNCEDRFSNNEYKLQLDSVVKCEDDDECVCDDEHNLQLDGVKKCEDDDKCVCDDEHKLKKTKM